MASRLQLPNTNPRRLNAYDQAARNRAQRLSKARQRINDRLVIGCAASFITGVVTTALYFAMICRA
jgi:hypothetical protein